MLIVFLALLTGMAQQGKVVVQAGVAEAEFYLDGNFVAKTDQNGTLTMESFPAGSFKFSVKMEGYKEYEGEFTIGEGESKLLHVQLARLKGTLPPEEFAQDSSSAARARRTRNQANAPAKVETKPAPPPVTKPAAPQTAPTPVPADQGESSLWPWALIGTITLGGWGYWYWKRKTTVEEPEPTPLMEQKPEEPAAQTPKPAPEFIDELRRKEELMNAGLIGGKRREIDREEVQKKEKEIVIVLPKEAYDIKDTD